MLGRRRRQAQEAAEQARTGLPDGPAALETLLAEQAAAHPPLPLPGRGDVRMGRGEPVMLAVPNVSEGRDLELLHTLGTAFGAEDAALLDIHADPDHNRSVFTLAGPPGALSRALVHGAQEAVRRLDVRAHRGEHPRIGVLDVAPVVYLDPADAGAATAEALVLADLLGELGLPVLLYGELGGGRTRADLRRGGPDALARRLASGELSTDFGPATLHERAGAVLVTARPPLVAFNVNLRPPVTLERAKEVAALIREGGEEGLPGVRALGLRLGTTGVIQITTNIEDHRQATPEMVVAAIAAHVPVAAAELVALAPEASLARFPGEVPLIGFDPSRHLIERALAQVGRLPVAPAGSPDPAGGGSAPQSI